MGPEDQPASASVTNEQPPVTPPPETPAAPPAERKSRNFVANLFQERAKRTEVAARESEAKAFQAEKQRVEDAKRRDEDLRSRAKKDPKAVHEILNTYGLSSDDIIRANLGIAEDKPEPTEEDRIKAMIDAAVEPYKKKTEEWDAWKDQQSKQQEDYSASLDRKFNDGIQAELSKGTEAGDYEFVKIYGPDVAAKEIREIMELNYEQTGIIIDISEACAIFEEHVQETFVLPLMNTKKLRSLWEQQQAKIAAETPPAAAPKTPVDVKKASANTTLKQSLVSGADNASDDELDRVDREQAFEILKQRLLNKNK